MVFQLGNAVNTTADSVYRLPVIKTIMGNPILTAMLVTMVIVLIAICMWGKNLFTNKSGFRFIIYTLISVTLILVVHHYATTHLIQTSTDSEGVRNVVDGVLASSNSSQQQMLSWGTSTGTNYGTDIGTSSTSTGNLTGTGNLTSADKTGGNSVLMFEPVQVPGLHLM